MLTVGIFENENNADMVRFVEMPATVGVRCSLPGWLQRAEWAEVKQNYYASYHAYQTELGRRVAFMDKQLNVICDGWLYEAIPDGRHVIFVAGGAWKHHSDRLVTDTFTATDTIDTVITNVLSSYVSHIDSSTTRITGSSTAIGNLYAVAENAGSTVADIISNLMSFSDSSNNIYDYWLQSQPLVANKLVYPIPYLTARNNSTADYVFSESDLRHRPQQSRHIWQLATRTLSYYRLSTTLSANAASGATALTVSSISGFSDNDEIEIVLDSGTRQTTTINGAPAGSTINIDSALTHAAASGNVVSRLALTATSTNTNSGSESSWWRVDRTFINDTMNQAQAEQYRDAYAGIYNEAVAQNAFVVAASRVQTAGRVAVPNVHLLKRPFYFEVADFEPDRVFFSTSVDYDGYSFRIVPDVPDQRLDALLKRAGIQSGEMVWRGEYTTRPHGIRRGG